MPRRAPFVFTDVEQDTLLLVEGVNDARFFSAFLSHLQKPDVQIANVGGKDNIGPFLIRTLVPSQNFTRLRSLGIARDADNNADSAFQSLRYYLTNAGLPTPSQSYTPTQSRQLTVSIALLPDGDRGSTGELEDLCLRSLQGQPVMACVDQYIECLANAGMPCQDLSKSKVSVFLAGRYKPELRLGEAAEAGAWDWNSPAFGQLAQFLRNL